MQLLGLKTESKFVHVLKHEESVAILLVKLHVSI